MLPEHDNVFKANPPTLSSFSVKNTQRDLLTAFAVCSGGEGEWGVGNERKLCGGQHLIFLQQ